MTEPKETPLGQIDLPYGRLVMLKATDHESGLRLLRLTFREGRRFTTIDVDAVTARSLADALTDWAGGVPEN